MSIPSKDKDALLDYTWDWAPPKSPTNPKGPWLAEGETLTSAVVTVPDGIVKDRPETFTPEGIVTVWLKGGTDGKVYTLACRVTTNQGRTDERSFAVRVTER